MFFDNWNPFFDVTKTLEEFDRMFGSVGRPIGLRSVPRGTFPPINIYNQNDKALLIAEIPGLKTKDIELTVLGDSVTLKCERQDEAVENERFYRKERATGIFSRTVTLPDSVDPDSVKATYKNGVLKVQMEKAKEARARKIKVKS
jgi:HSP20 family protein